MKVLGGKGALFAALILGSLTSFLVWRYVQQTGEAARPVEMAPVVVAATAISPRTVITQQMVRLKQVPVEARHPNAFGSPNEVIGKVARSPMTTDEQVLNTRLYLQREESGLAFMVPEGMRAVSVGFTEVIGSGGNILPGDHVDVVGVFEVQLPLTRPFFTGPVLASGGDEKKGYASLMVLQDVEVLAVAQRLEGEVTDSGPTRMAQESGLFGASSGAQQSRSNPAAQPQAKTATLAVSPEDSLRLVLAEEKGKIRLALRRAKDTSIMDQNQGPFTIVNENELSRARRSQ